MVRENVESATEVGSATMESLATTATVRRNVVRVGGAVNHRDVLEEPTQGLSSVLRAAVKAADHGG